MCLLQTRDKLALLTDSPESIVSLSDLSIDDQEQVL